MRFHLQTYFRRFLRLLADIGSEPMFAALRDHFQEWRSIKKAQGMRSDNPYQPQHTSGTAPVTADQRHGDVIPRQLEARVPSHPETTDGNFDTSPKDYEGNEVVERDRDKTAPSWKESTHTNTNGDVDVPI